MSSPTTHPNKTLSHPRQTPHRSAKWMPISHSALNAPLPRALPARELILSLLSTSHHVSFSASCAGCPKKVDQRSTTTIKPPTNFVSRVSPFFSFRQSPPCLIAIIIIVCHWRCYCPAAPLDSFLSTSRRSNTNSGRKKKQQPHNQTSPAKHYPAAPPALKRVELTTSPTILYPRRPEAGLRCLFW